MCREVAVLCDVDIWILDLGQPGRLSLIPIKQSPLFLTTSNKPHSLLGCIIASTSINHLFNVETANLIV